ncbi:hypothetical protein [Roseovarius sp. D22-M7]|uniref:hypothetical protein n=1 Tax=Roseovarius sp. D22-M7 TaxID=3127116 RepID=UPI0030104C39
MHIDRLGLFGLSVIALNVVLLPLVFSLHVSKPNVDMAYYFLGLIGVILFFEAERFEREISELRQSSFDAAQAVQSINQAISSSRDRSQRQLVSAQQELEALRNASERDQRMFAELKDDNSELSLDLANHTRSRVVARSRATDANSDVLEKKLLDELEEIEVLSSFVNYHNFGPRHANLVRTAMDPTESIVPFRVRECLLEQAKNCEFGKDKYQQAEDFIAQLQGTLAGC